MIALLLSILASSLIFVIFKLFDTYKIDTLQAIVVNYVIACGAGLISYQKPIDLGHISNQNWFLGTFLLGVLFIIVFNLMAITTQKNGLSVVAVASKMSIAIPVIFGIFIYNEGTGFWKLTGISIAMLSVYLTSVKSKDGIQISRKDLIFPLLVFIGSGIIDTSLKFLETNYVAKEDVALFSAAIFGFAAIIGVLVLSYQVLIGKASLKLKNLIGGIALGVPNFFSIYFLIQALRTEGMESATIFTINNVAILIVSTLLGIALFKEKLLPKNWIGILLATISIILIATIAQ